MNYRYFNILLFLSVTYLLNYNSASCQKYFSIGANKFGIAIGKPVCYSGIRLNVFDRKYLRNDSISIETNYKINGISISIIDKTSNMKCNGLHFSLINDNVRGYINGAFIGIININKLYKCKCYVFNNGITVAAYNFHIRTSGLQLGLINYYSESWVDVGVINRFSRSKVILGAFNTNISQEGIRIGFVNGGRVWFNKRAFEDIWIGIINIKKYQNAHNNSNSTEYIKTIDNNGIQIGLINYCETCKFQFGLFNYIKSKSKFKLMPLINFKRY